MLDKKYFIIIGIAVIVFTLIGYILVNHTLKNDIPPTFSVSDPADYYAPEMIVEIDTNAALENAQLKSKVHVLKADDLDSNYWKIYRIDYTCVLFYGFQDKKNKIATSAMTTIPCP